MTPGIATALEWLVWAVVFYIAVIALKKYMED